MTSLPPPQARTYLNPVFPQTFADPFVLKYRGQYWAYCTGLQEDGGAFGVLRSPDLVSWQAVGSAMVPLPGDHPCYWAPEVTYDNGRFYLYYSVGNEERMHIRVAASSNPAGPFVDSGRRLTAEPFAIDPHVFRDDDGQRYLFYATDFYDHTHIGTGTVRDRLIDPFTLARAPQPVTRPQYDWQVYDAQREEKGGVRWHTIEGPFVLKRKGTYYQMFSGGNWQNPSYGVAYAVAGGVGTSGEWQQVCDGERVPPILQTVRGVVKGPGHNSVVRGPDNMQPFCVYHRWADGGGRQMAIDALDWAGERLLVLGPSHTPQRAPLPPYFADFLADEGHDRPRAAWEQAGSAWVVREGAATPQVEAAATELRYTLSDAYFVAEVSIAGGTQDKGSWGVALYERGQSLLQARLAPGAGEAIVTWRTSQGTQQQRFALPDTFDFAAYHLLRLEVAGQHACVALDDGVISWQDTVAAGATTLALRCESARAAFSGFALTRGWQTLFTDNASLQAQGWRGDHLQAWQVSQQRLVYNGKDGSRLCGEPRFASYQLVVNAALEHGAGGACYGFLPALDGAGEGPLLTVSQADDGWRLTWRDGEEATVYPLPQAFDAGIMQQFRFIKEGGRLTVFWEAHHIADGPVTAGAAQVGLYAHGGPAAFDMVRVIAFSGASFANE